MQEKSWLNELINLTKQIVCFYVLLTEEEWLSTSEELLDYKERERKKEDLGHNEQFSFSPRNCTSFLKMPLKFF